MIDHTPFKSCIRLLFAAPWKHHVTKGVYLFIYLFSYFLISHSVVICPS